MAHVAWRMIDDWLLRVAVCVCAVALGSRRMLLKYLRQLFSWGLVGRGCHGWTTTTVLPSSCSSFVLPVFQQRVRRTRWVWGPNGVGLVRRSRCRSSTVTPTPIVPAVPTNFFCSREGGGTASRPPSLVPFPTTTATSTSKSSRIELPLRDTGSVASPLRRLKDVLNAIVNSTSFLECVVHSSGPAGETTTPWQWSCAVPAFGPDCRLTATLLGGGSDSDNTGSTTIVLLSMVGHASSGLDDAQEQQQQHVVDVDFGWICTKLYEHRASLNEIVDCSKQLREQVVVQHSNVDAASAAWSPTQTTAFERHVWRSENRRPGGGAEKKEEDAVQHFLHRLETNGYAIVDCHNNTDATAHHHHHHDDPLPVSSWHTTSRQQDQLSQYYLDQASRQGRSVRTDRVHFLSRAQAQTCGILDQYELLLGLAHFLNDNHHHQITSHNNNNNDPDGILHPIASSPYWQPVRPATTQRPLTLPRSVQFAEYGCGDYYVAHSDNALTDRYTPDKIPIRSNFRAYTCILYMNDNNWNLELDGGALRLYPDTQDCTSIKEVVSSNPFVDIAPINGRLLVFDSRLIHAVQPVTSTTKCRRAMTLWIQRPNNSGAGGDGTFGG